MLKKLAILCAAATMISVGTVKAEVVNPPDTPMTTILEINRDYLKVLAYGINTDPNNPSFSNWIPFDTSNPEHTDQIFHEAEFGCRLYDRVSVYLSHLNDANVSGDIFLFACAIP